MLGFESIAIRASESAILLNGEDDVAKWPRSADLRLFCIIGIGLANGVLSALSTSTFAPTLGCYLRPRGDHSCYMLVLPELEQ